MHQYIWGLLVSVVVIGCGPRTIEQAATPASSPARRPGVQLTVLVVDDPNLAAAINLIRGEWAERSGGELEVGQWSWEELHDAKELPCDVVVYPSRLLGTLVERQWLRPVRDSLLQDEQFNFQDILPLLRDRTIRYGGKVFALPLGDPPLMLAWQGDLPPELLSQEVIDWNQFDDRSVQQLQNSPLEYPLAIAVIARAVTYSDRKSDSAVLFDPQTMEPRLLEPPFLRAIQELVERSKKATTDRRQLRAMLSWPTSVTGNEQENQSSTLSFTVIPSSDEVYLRTLRTWSTADQQAELPTMLGFAGRLASVTHASPNAVSAFKLLQWMTGGEVAIQLSSRSTATTWFRRSQTSQSQRWFEGLKTGETITTKLTKLLSSDDAYLLPRIPGIDEYLQSLDHAVDQAISGHLEGETALRDVTEHWNSITERYGKEQQQTAYRRHLGLDLVPD